MKPSPGPSAAPDTPSSVRCLLDLPPECLALVLASLAVRDVLAAAATCPALKVAADDPILWRNLLWQVWIATAARGAEKADFAARLLRYQQASSMRAGVGPDSTGAAVEAELPERPSEARPLPLSQWLRSYDAPDAALAGVWRQRLMWSGSTDQCHGDTVGCACVHGSPTPQPFGSGRVVYYEVRVLSQGEHGFIAVGWSPEGFPSKNKQPGWVRHTYGYHGDDGHVYSSFGYGRRFGAPFGTGRTVGTGLVLPPPGAPPDRCHGAIFFTVDGELCGAPFPSVPAPTLLRPAVGVHSVGEQVELHFGDGAASVAEASPPRRPSPFAFDLAEYCAREGGAVRAPAAAAGRARDREAAQSSHPRLQASLEQMLPWVLHEVLQLAFLQEPPEGDDYHELQRFARSHHPLSLHPSWGVPTLDELQPEQLQQLCKQLLTRFAQRHALEDYDGAAPSDEESDDEEDGQ